MTMFKLGASINLLDIYVVLVMDDRISKKLLFGWFQSQALMDEQGFRIA